MAICNYKESSMSDEKVKTEVFKVSADETVAKIKEIVAEGNVRRIIIQNEDGKTLIEFPLTIGVAAAAGLLLLAPLLAAVGVLAAIVTDLTIVVEREE
jgi:CBS domain-containing protein